MSACSGGEGRRVATETGTWLGPLFESLTTQSVRVYAAGTAARVGHLRTRETDREIDLIVEGDDRRVVAIEVKLAESVSDRDVRHLNWLQDQIGDRLADRVLVTRSPGRELQEVCQPNTSLGQAICVHPHRVMRQQVIPGRHGDVRIVHHRATMTACVLP